MTLGAIADVTGGTVHGDPDTLVTAPASIDSRAVDHGGLFVAISGEHVDGHDFVAAALERGAAAVLGSRVVQAPCVLVADATAALGLLARHVIDRIAPTVIAVTGSQGKTSVKDLLAHLLDADVVATRGNNNNELGVPLTVLRAQESTRHLVVEMGARGIGHIAQLCRIAPPDVAAVLNVGSAHVGEFGSVENIAVAKGEIVEALRPGGTAVLNADDPRVRAMVDRVPAGAQVVTFGTTPEADVRIVTVELDDAGEPDVTLDVHGVTRTRHVPVVGGHNGANLAAAAAILTGVPDHGPGLDAPDGLADFVPASPMRMQRHRRSDGVVVVDDSYNANPESSIAALEAVARMAGRRRVAVLGEMLELGADAHERHVEVGRHAAELGFDRILAVGDGATGVAEGAGALAEPVSDVSVAVDTLRAWLGEGDVVLVKASRGARLERVTEGLLAD